MRKGLEMVQSIETWRIIDERPVVPAARVDERGFWRLPLATAEVLARPFETDQRVLGGFGQGEVQNEGVVHFYQPSALILGKLDRKLARFPEAEAWAEAEGIPRVLRISGGQAIVSDHGVLNVSLLMPKPQLPIREGFAVMAELVGACLQRVTGLVFDVGRVDGSYCPGDYDLSYGGKKVAGIAQRRVKGAVALMAYVSVSGDQAARARLVREYYRRGGADDSFPQVDPAVMTQVEDLVAEGSLLERRSVKMAIEMIKQHFLSELGTIGR